MSFVVDVNRVSDMEVKDANLRGSSSTNTQAESIYEKLKNSAEYGNIETLYKLIAEDPNILGHFDEVPFCETPLHVAAEKGQTNFAMELMTLKPSLASKLNVSGLSPMHLALENNHIRMVRGFVAMDSSLVRIKGRGRITPLHHVAKIGEADLLGEFLFACPSSVEDLTINCETAVHVAVKNNELMTFKVLLGWLKRVNKTEILDWKDEDGNTVYHIAALKNQTEVMKLVRKTVKVNAKNLDGKTAMDLLHIQQPSCFNKPRRLLHNVKDRLLFRSPKTLAEYLSKNISFMEKRNNLLGLSNLSLTRERSVNTSDHRDAILVVAILIVTATYQAGLSPPGGFWQEDSNSTATYHANLTATYSDYSAATYQANLTATNSDNSTIEHIAGQMTMFYYDALFFLSLNGFAFITSLYAIIYLIIGLPMWKLMYFSMAAITIAMLASYRTIFPTPHYFRKGATIQLLFVLGFPLIVGGMLLATFTAFIIHKRRRNRVDFPAICFRRSETSHRGYLLLFGGICISLVVYFLMPPF